MTVPEVEQAAISLEKLTRNGVPNYFDRQRFGSRGDSGEFVALPWCQGRYERALWLALTSGTPSDRPRDRSEKAVIRDHWGDWDTCLRKVSTASRRRILAHLAIRHQDFRGALARIDAEIRGLYLAAFQSHVWNRMLEKLLRETCGPECLHEVSLDDCLRPIHRSLDEGELGKLAAVSLPLPSARLHLDEGPVRRLVEDAVRDEGLELRQMRVKYPRDSFFSKGWRKAAVFPEHCQRVADDDEIYVGRRKMTLRFQLPRGSYATVLVKCVTAKPCG
jgi:tRNA pseudouridine13 synthase